MVKQKIQHVPRDPDAETGPDFSRAIAIICPLEAADDVDKLLDAYGHGDGTLGLQFGRSSDADTVTHVGTSTFRGELDSALEGKTVPDADGRQRVGLSVKAAKTALDALAFRLADDEDAVANVDALAAAVGIARLLPATP